LRGFDHKRVMAMVRYILKKDPEAYEFMAKEAGYSPLHLDKVILDKEEPGPSMIDAMGATLVQYIHQKED
jgi:N-glycosylase/DNA lyase